jgi:hypothetical protein
MKVPLTPEEVIKFGEIATSLREWCRANGKNARDINRIIGKNPSYSSGYQYLNGKLAPSPYYRALLSQGTGIPESKLMVKKLTTAVVTTSPPVNPTVNSKPTDVLSFTVSNNGEARIKLDVTLPIDSAAALFRMILDAGIVMGSQHG